MTTRISISYKSCATGEKPRECYYRIYSISTPGVPFFSTFKFIYLNYLKVLYLKRKYFFEGEVFISTCQYINVVNLKAVLTRKKSEIAVVVEKNYKTSVCKRLNGQQIFLKVKHFERAAPFFHFCLEGVLLEGERYLWGSTILGKY